MSQEEKRPQIVMDYSTMSDFLKCKLRGYYRHILNLVPLQPSLPLIAGSAMHEALASWYKDHDREKAISILKYVWGLAEENWADFTSQHPDTLFGPDFGDSKRNLPNLVSILGGYFNRYQQEPFEIISNEFPFQVPLGSDRDSDYILTGRIDLMVNWGNQVYVMDHKTTSQLGSYYFSQFNPSLQLDGYAFAGREIFGKCDGVAINAILIAKTKQTFERDIFLRGEDDLAMYKKEAMSHMWEINQVKLSGDKPVRNTDACMLYGGCPYLELCRAKGDERVIESRYKVEIWNPFF